MRLKCQDYTAPTLFCDPGTNGSKCIIRGPVVHYRDKRGQNQELRNNIFFITFNTLRAAKFTYYRRTRGGKRREGEGGEIKIHQAETR